MANPPALRTAGDDDLDGLAPVYARAGWGDRFVDLLRFVRSALGGEVFVAEAGGTPVGVSSCVPFGMTGWIGGVLVVPERQRQGLGGALTERAVRWLLDQAVGTVLLHATDMGRPMYERLGFVAEGEYVRLGGSAGAGDGQLPASVRPAHAGDLAAVLALDRRATGEDRGVLLRAVWPSGGLVAQDAGVRGFHARATWGVGGTVVADDPDAGLALVDAVRAADPAALGSVALPAANDVAVGTLRGRGWQEQYRTTRMRLGPAVDWAPAQVFSAFNLFWG